MPNLLRRRRPSELIAVAGSLIIVLLFLAAALGIGMQRLHRLGPLRIAPSTLAISLLPVPATSWVIVWWSRGMPSPGARALRVVGTLVLLAVAVLSAALTLFVILVRPTPRAS